MKGPSLEAIKKFKQLQEEKKRLEYDKKIKEKLTTLEHRAAHGDKKAKTQLKQIEKDGEDRSKPSDSKSSHSTRPSSSAIAAGSNNAKATKHNVKSSSNRPKQAGFDFDELMKLAANNTNEVKKVEKKEPGPVERRPNARCPPDVLQAIPERLAINSKPTTKMVAPTQVVPKSSTKPPAERAKLHPSATHLERQPVFRHHMPQQVRPRMPPRRLYRDDDEYDDEDDYESDGFVVDDDDDEVQDELKKTLRTVFRYDKRRCDLREQELDRQYRAIGRVNTFEDLEREERRATRLAAAEDAEALRDLEERKRLKKQRLKGLRD